MTALARTPAASVEALSPEPASELLSPLARLEALCDPRSLELIRTRVLSEPMGERSQAGDGVLAGSGLVEGRPVFCYAEDPAYLGGSLGAAHAGSIVRVLELAARAGAPVVGFVSSGGARMQEGVAALAGYGQIFRRIVALSGEVPQISVVSGLSAGGGAYSPALTDWVVMTRESSMFLTGPAVVRDALGEQVTAAELGGHRVHERNGVCHLVADDDRDAVSRVRELLSFLPSRRGLAAPMVTPAPPPAFSLGDVVPSEPRRVYDVRDVIRGLVDGGELFEIAPGWAKNLVTGFARIDGRTVGLIANQPRWLGGVLDASASEKGARFVAQCDAFSVPLLVLVDTPGFMPGARQESDGVIRRGAELVHAFAASEVPRVTVILRKAFGGAFITMNSKDLGADYVFAWPGAELGIMGALPAVGVINRRDLAEAEDPAQRREALAAEYADRHLRPELAAAGGFIDELIEPSQTRARVAAALRSLRR